MCDPRCGSMTLLQAAPTCAICSAAKQPIERNAGPWNSERCTWKTKPPSTTSSCPWPQRPRARVRQPLLAYREVRNADRARGRRALRAPARSHPRRVAYYPPLARSTSPRRAHAHARGASRRSQAAPRWACRRRRKEQLEADLPGAYEFSSDRNFADYLYLTKTIAAYEARAWRRSAERRTSSSSCTAARRPSSHRPRHMDELRATSRFGSRRAAVAAPTSTPSSWSIERSCST